MGRNVAGATFLDGFVRYAEVDRYVGVAHGGEAAAIFRRRIAEITAGDPVRSARPVAPLAPTALGGLAAIGAGYSSEERRVGQEGVKTGSARGTADHKKKKKN